MKKISQIALAAFLVALTFAACKKTENGPVLSAQEKSLTSKVWILKALTVKNADGSSDSSIMKSCADSSAMAFDIYKAYQLASGSKVACDSIAVPYDKGTWALSADADSLTLKGKRNFVWRIEKLNDTIIKATFRDSVATDKNWLKTITFK